MSEGTSNQDYEEMIAQAEAAIAALRDCYREQLVQDVAALFDIWARLDEGAAPIDVLKDVHAIAHNIKGQGGSFGYDLVTTVGASLCDYIRSDDRSSEEALKIVRAHLECLKTIADEDISGTGGGVGADMESKLAALTH